MRPAFAADQRRLPLETIAWADPWQTRIDGDTWQDTDAEHDGGHQLLRATTLSACVESSGPIAFPDRFQPERLLVSRLGGCHVTESRMGVVMTLEQLRVFVAVAERQHMTQAAADLNIAQSAVSATVSSLETEYRTRLFDRVGRTIRLTPIGRCFLDEARGLLGDAERTRRAMRACTRTDGAEATGSRSD